MWHACLFEAKSIQDYILRSGRLRHIVGASELIDGLTGDLLDDCLAALRLREGQEILCSRRSGGAVYLFSDDKDQCDAFRDLWSLVVRQYAPGLSFTLACGAGDTAHAAFERARAELDAQRNRPAAELPAGTPVTDYARRTGRPAVARHSKLGSQDAATARFGLDIFWRKGGLTEKFARGLDPDFWPRNLEYNPDAAPADERAFPFVSDNRYLGLLHADGNGLGEVLLRLAQQVRTHHEEFIRLFRAFSDAVSRATKAAAQRATESVLSPARESDGQMPARPIVLGGDDLTMLLRADLALPFARSFLAGFEEETARELESLRGDFSGIGRIPEALTAGAGIAFVKSNHPFHIAHELAESLAQHAKKRAKAFDQHGRIPPTIAFHRVTKASHGEYAAILSDEMTFGSDEDSVRSTLAVYTADREPQDFPALADLQALVRLLGAEQMARGPSRQVLTLMGRDLNDARRRYVRWCEVMQERDPGSYNLFHELLGRLCGRLRTDLPVSAEGTPPATPLGDVATLLAVTHGASTRDGTAEEVA